MKINKQAFVRCFDKSFMESIEAEWFAVSHRIIDRQFERDGFEKQIVKDKAKVFRRNYRGKWFKISSDKGAIYRLLKFNPNLKLVDDKSEMAIDWQGFIELSDFATDLPESLNLELKPANFFETIIANMKHPDAGVRAAYKLSLFLGLLSLVISLVQLFI
jgi:hypothetical protein